MSMISELVKELRIRADVEGRGTINEHLMTKAADTIEMLSEKVREPKHGEWIKAKPKGVISYSEAYAECDQCHEAVFIGWSMNFCPNCGADMRKGASDADATDKKEMV